MKYCTYCGDNATDRDHVIPVSYTSITRNYKPGTTIPCCKHCNSLLGNKHYVTIDTRALHVLNRLTNGAKYKKILKTAKWDEEELNEIGDNMRDFIRGQMWARQWIERRMDNLELVAEGYNSTPINDPFRRQYKSIVEDLMDK